MKKLDLTSKHFIFDDCSASEQILILVDTDKLKKKANETVMNFGASVSNTRLPFEDKFENKFERAIDFISNNFQIKVPYMIVSDNGDIFSLEGNHRFKAMEKLFSKKAVVSISKNSLETCKNENWFINTYDDYLINQRVDNLNTFINESKVVDDFGKPLVAYHGTRENFNFFDKGKRGASNCSDDSRHGFFFTSNVEVANSYSEQIMSGFLKYQKAVDDFQDKKISYYKMKKVEDWFNFLSHEEKYGKEYGANIIPVYLNFKNPKIISHMDRFESKAFEFEIIYAKEQGYDSIIFENIVDDISYMGASTNRGNTYVAFESNQIKSIFDTKFNKTSSILNEKSSLFDKHILEIKKESIKTEPEIDESHLNKILKKYDDSQASNNNTLEVKKTSKVKRER